MNGSVLHQCGILSVAFSLEMGHKTFLKKYVLFHLCLGIEGTIVLSMLFYRKLIYLDYLMQYDNS